MSALKLIREGRDEHSHYKHDTEVFKYWLFDTAVECGWTKTKKNSSAVKDIRSQINLVSKTKIEQNYLPEDVYTALIRAIKGRKAFLKAFGSTKLANKVAEDSHRYFIYVLEYAVAKLSPVKPATEPENPISANNPPIPSNDDSQDDSQDGWNLVKSRKTKPKHR